jgi:hypothetical protein
MQVDRYEVSITADGSGNGTGFTATPVRGRILAIRYVPDGTSPYATGVDVTVTGAVSGIAITTITNAGTSAIDVYPRAAIATTVNAAGLYAVGGAAVLDLIPVADEKVQITIAQAGASAAGKFHVYIG